MFGLEENRQYYVCQRYVRMNLGINGLSKLVSQEMKRPLLSGDVFIFFGKNRQMVKLLCWDGDGFLLYQKRLEQGTFELPIFKPGQKAVEMPYRTLSAIMRGVSLKWEAIENIFTRGDYRLDNNLVERLNRYISLSRRNSLFFGSHKGAERAAMFYSLACSCRLNNINFFEYISDVINRTALMQPNTDIKEYRMLLPDLWKTV